MRAASRQGVAIALTFTTFAAGACSALRDARGDACGYTDQPFTAQFPMQANTYHLHFPNMGLSPELDAMGNAEVFVVVFPGPIELVGVGKPGAGPPPPARNVVCVATGDDVTLYTNVDLTGMRQ